MNLNHALRIVVITTTLFSACSDSSEATSEITKLCADIDCAAQGFGGNHLCCPLPDAAHDPCSAIQCPETQACNFSNGQCEDISSMDLEKRSPTAICPRWRTLAPLQDLSTAIWSGNIGACELGTYRNREETFNDFSRAVGVYRWLSGLPLNLPENTAERENVQACAVSMAANEALNHNPQGTAGWQCASDAAQMGASTSNLAGIGGSSFNTPANAIPLWAEDAGEPTLGHRRWLLFQQLSALGMGYAEVQGSQFITGYSCLGWLGQEGMVHREWTAYPAPGPVPLETTEHQWSVHSPSISFEGARVVVARIPDGLVVNTQSSVLDPGFGDLNALGFSFSGNRPEAGHSYRVMIQLGGESIAYTVSILSCS